MHLVQTAMFLQTTTEQLQQWQNYPGDKGHTYDRALAFHYRGGHCRICAFTDTQVSKPTQNYRHLHHSDYVLCYLSHLEHAPPPPERIRDLPHWCNDHPEAKSAVRLAVIGGSRGGCVAQEVIAPCGVSRCAVVRGLVRKAPMPPAAPDRDE